MNAANLLRISEWISTCVFICLTLNSNAATCTETASSSGQDDGPVTTTINSFPCTSGGTITAMTLDANIGTWCPSWYTYDIIVNGTTVATSQCNQTGFNLNPYLPITSVSIRSNDTDAWSDFITLNLTLNITYISGPMVYSSCTSIQPNTSTVPKCSGNQEIIGIQVVTTGETSPLNLTQIQMNMTGCTNIADVSNIDVFYTGTSSSFTPTTIFGSLAPGGGTLSINGNQTLATGTNYFWIAYDLATTATISNVLDARGTRITVNGSNYTPTTTNPAGTRTIAACTISPGGISSTLTAWFHANAGTSTTTNGANMQTWTNQAANVNVPNITQPTASQRPVYRTNAINFNPIIAFDGVNDFLYRTSTLGSDLFNASNNTILMMHKMYSGIVYFKWEHATNNTPRIGFEYSGGKVRFDFPTSDPGNQNVSNTSYTTYGEIVSAHTGNNLSTIRINGNQDVVKTTSGTMSTSVSREFIIGNNPTNNPLPTRIDFAELIIYNSQLNGQQLNTIESYMAIKYGVTLGINGTSTNYNSVYGLTIWNASLNSGYNYDIAGIGREDNTVLNQRKSRTINEVGGGTRRDIVTIANGNNFTTPAAFSADQSYFVWGHNNGNLSGQWQGVPIATTNSEAIQSLFIRKWKSQETGTVGTTTLEFDMTAVPGVGGTAGNNDLANLRLLVDADGDFSSGALSISPSSFNNATDLVQGQENRTVKLHWSTLSEVHTNYYELEKSEDLMTWEHFKYINPKGDILNRADYVETDESPYNLTYYRLTEFNHDLEIGYRDIKAVKFTEEFEFQIMPNPSNGNFMLHIYGKNVDNIQYSLYDNLGRRITNKKNINIGINHLDFKQLSKGIYIIYLYKNGELNGSDKLIINQ